MFTYFKENVQPLVPYYLKKEIDNLNAIDEKEFNETSVNFISEQQVPINNERLDIIQILLDWIFRLDIIEINDIRQLSIT